MDPRGVGTVTLELNQTCARLLAKLCAELDNDDPAGVISRALGVLELALGARRRGARLCFINERGETSDVVF